MEIESIKPGMSADDAKEAARDIQKALRGERAPDGEIDLQDIDSQMSREQAKRAAAAILKALRG